MSRRLLVLAWHNVTPTAAFPGRAESAGRSFHRQIGLLRRITHIVDLGSALRHLAAGGRLPPRSVALTFDDGYRDNLDVAVPILSHYRLPATFFLVTEFLPHRARMWWEDLAWAMQHTTNPHLDFENVRYPLAAPSERGLAGRALAERLKTRTAEERNRLVDELTADLAFSAGAPEASLLLDWAGARRLRGAGYAIGAHTCTHPILGRESPETQRAELADSRAALREHLGGDIDLLAYPNGRHCDCTDTTVREAELAGYRFALTTETGLATSEHAPFAIPRCVVDPFMSGREIGALVRELCGHRRV
jgi:peptidoglycan/xylan/chitin deacetylase (PgdA/CDA1 family)